MAKVRCYAMYGLIGGPFPYGLYYSAGLDLLGKKLRKLGPDVEVLPTFGWSEWKKIVRDINRRPTNERIVIYGHSMGANQLSAITRRISSRAVDLVAAFDPTIWYPIPKFGDNVRHLIWFKGKNIFSLAGHGQIRTTATFNGSFEKHDVCDRHEKIDDNTDLHGIVLRAVKGLAAD